MLGVGPNIAVLLAARSRPGSVTFFASFLTFLLACRLEASLRELQAVLGERDALKASLDEALGRYALTLTLTPSPTLTLTLTPRGSAASVRAMYGEREGKRRRGVGWGAGGRVRCAPCT